MLSLCNPHICLDICFVSICLQSWKHLTFPESFSYSLSILTIVAHNDLIADFPRIILSEGFRTFVFDNRRKHSFKIEFERKRKSSKVGFVARQCCGRFSDSRSHTLCCCKWQWQWQFLFSPVDNFLKIWNCTGGQSCHLLIIWFSHPVLQFCCKQEDCLQRETLKEEFTFFSVEKLTRIKKLTWVVCSHMKATASIRKAKREKIDRRNSGSS